MWQSILTAIFKDKDMTVSFNQSQIYRGSVRHRRFSQVSNQFQYQLYMLLLDIDEVSQPFSLWPFGTRWFHPIRFLSSDYLKGEPGSLKQRISNKVVTLGGKKTVKVRALIQARCFGLYFSPANFFFCYDEADKCNQVLVEVSNTPWNQRHYYLLNIDERKSTSTEKQFHVSPFMSLDMNYIWKIRPPTIDSNKMHIHIENRANSDNKKLFDVSLCMTKSSLNKNSALKLLVSTPVMTFKVVAGIYWQALRLFIKRVKFVPYQKHQG